MRVLIVDDERPARERLRRLLARHADMQIVGEAADGETALAGCAALAPDVLLLDIQMPGTGGLDIAASLPDPAPALIFVTAFDRYAVQAFDVAATDYLLKPVSPERLALALQRVRERAASGSASAGTETVAETVTETPARHAPPRQLLIRDIGRTHVIACTDIVWLEAADNYVVVHAAGRAPLMRRTLGGLLADLGDAFARSHRSAAVALAHVASVQTQAHGDGWVLLKNGTQVPLSRQYRARLLAQLGREN